ncbi:TrkA family potassium uptake protein [Nocardioides rotundus]|nr:TrkA family potassium uptake protein [Nocardioides rotundus]
MIGLGRFGQALALELAASDTDVLGIDSNPQVVDKMSGLLTHVVQADATDEDAMRQLGVDEFDRVVIGMGSDLEASILTASVLKSMGVPDIWAKAISAQHERILRQIGVNHVVRPEHDTGRRVAHLLAGGMLDYIEFDDGYAIVKMYAPDVLTGKALTDTQIRRKYGVTIVGVKRRGEEFTYAGADTVLQEGDLILVSGDRRRVERFASLNTVG